MTDSGDPRPDTANDPARPDEGDARAGGPGLAGAVARGESGISRALVIGALAAVSVLVLGAVVAGTYLLVDRASGKDGGKESRERTVSVFLCGKSSSNRRCQGGATEEQKRVVREKLQGMPKVRSVTYRSREQAWEILKKEVAGKHDEWLKDAQPSDLPDSFRAEVANEEDAKAVKAALADFPGVDTVVSDPVKPRA